MKLGRTYQMSIQGQFLTWTPAFPLTLEFDVQRSTFASANKATFTLYNLQVGARRDIYFDRFVQNQRLKVTLQAGYQGTPTLPVIFQGDIRVAWSERRGVNWITQVECFDGGIAFYNAQVSVNLQPGWTMASAAKALIAPLAPFGVSLGKVSNIRVASQAPFHADGSAWEQLKKLVPGDGQLFVDNGVCNILNPQDHLVTAIVPVISSQTGLLATPRKQGNLITVRMIFDPQYVVGQLVKLDSLESWLNSPALKVVGVHHYGKISGTEGGDLVTELSLFAGYTPSSLTPVDAAFEVANIA